jgi:tetratricopeptide (TPR) repeat protein
MKNYDEAEKYYLMAIENNVVISLYNIAKLYFETSNFILSEKYYLKVVENSNNNEILKKILLKIYTNLSYIYHKNNDYVNTIKYYLKIIEYKSIIPKNTLATIYHGLSKIYNKLKDEENAVKYSIEAANLNVIDSMICLGDYYDKGKKYDESIKYYSKIIEFKNDIKKHTLANIYHKLGMVYSYINDVKNTIKYLIQSADLDNIESMICLGNYYFSCENYDESIKYFENAVNKGNSLAMVHLSLIYSHNKSDYDSSIKYLSMAIEKSNEHSKAFVNNIALKHFNDNNYDVSLKYYHLSLHNNFIDTDGLYNMSHCYHKKEDYDNEIIYLKMIIERHTENEHLAKLVFLYIIYDFNIKDEIIYTILSSITNKPSYVIQKIQIIINEIYQNLSELYYSNFNIYAI